MKNALKWLAAWFSDLRRFRSNARALVSAQIIAARYRDAAEGMWKEEHERLRKMGEGARCGHPRQITKDGDVLPCAWPTCRHGVTHNWLREMVRFRPSFRIADPPISEPMMSVRTYERREAYVETTDKLFTQRSYFWILR